MRRAFSQCQYKFISSGSPRKTKSLWACAYILLSLTGTVSAADEILAERSKESTLSFRPARLIFFEGSHERASSYNLIASLPEAGHVPELEDTFPGTLALEPLQDVVTTQRYRWLQWSGGKYGFAVGAAASPRDSFAVAKGDEPQPVAISFYFQPNSLLFAPSYQYSTGSRDPQSGEREQSGYLDLYLLYLAPSGLRWVSIDPAVQHDFQSRRTTYSFGFEAGQVISSMFGNGGIYARPGVEISPDRPYDWNVQVGIHWNY